MHVCHVGRFDPQYSRNRTIRIALEAGGAAVSSCAVSGRGIGSLWRMAQVLRKSARGADVVLVGYSDHRFDVLLARLLVRRPVVWDAFYSIYDSRVNDRKLVPVWSPKAWWYWLLDYTASHCASLMLVDTNEHAKYFAKTFHVSLKKCIRVFLGTDTSVFCPRGVQEEPHSVGFYGKYIPLQGVDTIIRAAALLKDTPIRFELIGSGQTYAFVQTLAKELELSNVKFFPRISYEELPERIAKWQIVLGIFGVSEKASRVIPNKVYEPAAMGKAIITKDSPAIRELFTPGTDIVTCEPNPESLANAIKTLIADSALREKLGTAAVRTCNARLAPERIGTELVAELRTVVSPST